MKMRDLEARTGVHRETIRVWFREGLLPEPSRPARNVADYDEGHVRAILAIRELQKVSGLTLPEIKSAMKGRAPARRVEAGAFQHLEGLVAARVGYEKSTSVPIKSLRDRNPHAETDARVFVELGLIDPSPGEDGLELSLSDAKLIEIWGRMRAAGFMEGAGFPPDILDYYSHAAEYVAGNEAKLFLEQVNGRIDEDEAANMLQLALPLMLDFFGLIRQKAFMRNLRAGTREGKTIEIPPVPKPSVRKKKRARAD